ncbi:MAG: hypothetical protein IKK52_01950 [Alphaproteobacteria bacterium]|nr:hypothetical protein [Alphaproteobacteria bacterium]
MKKNKNKSVILILLVIAASFVGCSTKNDTTACGIVKRVGITGGNHSNAILLLEDGQVIRSESDIAFVLRKGDTISYKGDWGTDLNIITSVKFKD